MENTLLETSQPQHNTGTSTNSPSNSNTLKMLCAGLLFLLPVVGVGAYYLGTQSTKIAQVLDLPNPTQTSGGDNQVGCTFDAKLCPDGSSVGRTGPNCEFPECPLLAEKETWVRKQYMSNDQLVWDILQPPQTTANEAGLHEGYLGITSKVSGVEEVMAEFSHPIFTESPIPISLNDWVTQFMQKDLGDPFINRQIEDLTHSQGLQVKLIKTTSISPGGAKDVSMPMYFVLIWKHTDQTGKTISPSLITIKPVNNPTMDESALEAFTQKLVQGIRF